MRPILTPVLAICSLFLLEAATTIGASALASGVQAQQLPNQPAPVEAFLRQGCHDQNLAEACKDLGIYYHELGRQGDSRASFKRGCQLGSRVACRWR